MEDEKSKRKEKSFAGDGVAVSYGGLIPRTGHIFVQLIRERVP